MGLMMGSIMGEIKIMHARPEAMLKVDLAKILADSTGLAATWLQQQDKARLVELYKQMIKGIK